MKVLLWFVALIGIAAGGAAGQAPRQGPTLTDDSLRAIALRVTELEMRRQQASATVATIDSLLALYSDGVVYEHPNAGAVVRGKDVMRHNMTQFIGSVRAVRSETPRVTIGYGVAVVETTVRMEVDDNGKWIPLTRRGVRVIEVDSRGLIRRIIDYPW